MGHTFYGAILYSMKEYTSWALWIFNATYLFWGGAYFIQDFNVEYAIYSGIIFVVMAIVLLTLSYTDFPQWQLWLLSVWGLLHVFGGAIKLHGTTLAASHLYPVWNGGGDFYVLKYDQILHFILYAIVATMAHHLIRNVIEVKNNTKMVALLTILISVGVGALNEAAEFFISLNLHKNLSYGYQNVTLNILFNLAGALIAALLLSLFARKPKKTSK
jgi:putative membrane protein